MPNSDDVKNEKSKKYYPVFEGELYNISINGELKTTIQNKENKTLTIETLKNEIKSLLFSLKVLKIQKEAALSQLYKKKKKRKRKIKIKVGDTVSIKNKYVHLYSVKMHKVEITEIEKDLGETYFRMKGITGQINSNIFKKAKKNQKWFTPEEKKPKKLRYIMFDYGEICHVDFGYITNETIYSPKHQGICLLEDINKWRYTPKFPKKVER